MPGKGRRLLSRCLPVSLSLSLSDDPTLVTMTHHRFPVGGLHCTARRPSVSAAWRQSTACAKGLSKFHPMDGWREGGMLRHPSPASHRSPVAMHDEVQHGEEGQSRYNGTQILMQVDHLIRALSGNVRRNERLTFHAIQRRPQKNSLIDPVYRRGRTCMREAVERSRCGICGRGRGTEGARIVQQRLQRRWPQ